MIRRTLVTVAALTSVLVLGAIAPTAAHAGKPTLPTCEQHEEKLGGGKNCSYND